MYKSIFIKIINLIVIILGITFLSFLIVYISPSDSAEKLLAVGGMPVTEEALNAKREELGLNKPFLEQYGNWLSNIMKGDFGTSVFSKQPVLKEMVSKLPATIILAFASLLATLMVSIPCGILCAVKKDKLIDNVFRMFSFIGVSSPSFFISLLFIMLFSIKLKLFPVLGGYNIKGFIMPCMVLTIAMSSKYIRQIRGIILEQLSSDYVIGLRARGIKEWDILYKHVMKNSMLPIITLVGISLGGLLGGTAIVETIFSWPGLGKLAVDAINIRDYPIIQGYVVWMAFSFVVINGLVDISYIIFNPKLRRKRGLGI